MTWSYRYATTQDHPIFSRINKQEGETSFLNFLYFNSQFPNRLSLHVLHCLYISQVDCSIKYRGWSKTQNWTLSICHSIRLLQRKSEGSFTLKRLQNSSVDSDANMTRDKYTRGEIVANTVRAAGEPILKSHFGKEIIDDPFARFTDKVRSLIISLLDSPTR